MNILLTGGTGYIGSHTSVVLTQSGHNVVLLDNFCNSDRSILDRLKKILGKAPPLIEADIRDTDVVEKGLREYKIDAVIHFAGLKAVEESVANPILYYANNVQGSISLLQAMQRVGVKYLVFSSSATVYGQPQYLPYDEDHPTNPMNPYGQSKLQVEEILRDLSASDAEWKITCLRYFNPVGAHKSGLIGEDPKGVPNNLLPYIAKVAIGDLPHLNIYGNDYQTKDGTGERDYVHVLDLAEGHKAALKYLSDKKDRFSVFNLGTGSSTSVLDLVRSFEAASEKKISIRIEPRRRGDLPVYFSSVEKARKELGWVSRATIDEITKSTWNWQSKSN